MSHIISKPNRFIKPRFEWRPRHIPDHPLSQGLVAHWLFNEGLGNKVYDLSEFRNHGTLNNFSFTGSSGWLAGIFGTTLSFDGTDDYANMGSASSIDDIETKVSGLTASTWIYARSYGLNNNGAIIGKGSGNMIGFWRLMFSGASQVLFFAKNYQTTNLYAHINFPPSYLNTWKHVAITWDGSAYSSNIHFFINGQEATKTLTTDGAGNKQSDASNFLSVGSLDNYGSGGNIFDGLIDEVRLYNRVLSIKEIQQLYTDPFCDLEIPVYRKYWFVEEAPSFNPAWAKQSNVFIGHGAIL